MPILAALVMGACFESKDPIDSIPQAAVAPAVFGTWRCLPARGKVTDDPATLTVADLGQRRYSVVFDEDHYEGYTSVVRGRTIANLKKLGQDTHDNKPWSLVRYGSLRSDVLYLDVLRDHALPDDVPASDLRKRVEHLGEAAYEGFAVCVRAEAAGEAVPATH
jgi:hypothetical protein